MFLVEQNTAEPFSIYMGASGLTVAATLSKNGGSFNSVSPTITDRSNGYYSVSPSTSHRDTLGESAWLFSASGADDYPRVEQVVGFNPKTARVGAAAAGDAMTLQDGAITAAKFAANSIAAAAIAANAFNDKGNWAKAGDPMALIDGAITAAKFAANAIVAAVIADGALDEKGNWAKAGDDMGLLTADFNALIAAIEVEILNDGTGGAVIQTIADAVAAYFDNAGVDLPPQVIAAAVRTNLATELARLDENVSAPKNLTATYANMLTAAARLLTMLQVSGANWQFTADAVELAPSGGGGGGGTIVLPAYANIPDRVRGTLIRAFTGEIVSFQIPVYDASGDTVNLSALSLTFKVWDSTKTVFIDQAVTGTATGFNMTLDLSAETTQRLKCEWSLREDGAELITEGQFELIARP